MSVCLPVGLSLSVCVCAGQLTNAERTSTKHCRHGQVMTLPKLLTFDVDSDLHVDFGSLFYFIFHHCGIYRILGDFLPFLIVTG